MFSAVRLVLAHFSLLAPTLLALACGRSASAQEARAAVIVRQEGGGAFTGQDDVALQAALDRLKEGGGTLEIGPGLYLVRRALHVPSDVVLRGSAGAVLRLPAPVLCVAASAAGSRDLALSNVQEFVADTRIQILPPDGQEFFSDGQTAFLQFQRIQAVTGAGLQLVEPLPFEIPSGSRVGYSHKMLHLAEPGRVTIEDLTFDGGRVAEISMPGHHLRSAIWAAARFGFEEQRLGPPGEKVIVRHCVFRDLYGRGVALYHINDALVEGSVFANISDEAIDFDHFCERGRAVGNEIRDSTWGVVLNDASRCTVEYNNISGCEIGVFCWWYPRIPQQHVNEENLVRGNVIRDCSEASIRFSKTCHRNVIEHNFVENAIVLEEPTNRAERNTQL